MMSPLNLLKIYNNFTTYFKGNDFFRILFTRPIVALNSSGATRDCKPFGKFELKLLLNPKLKLKSKSKLIKLMRNNFHFFYLK